MGLSQQMVLVLGLLVQRAFSIEFNFALEKNKKMCFHELIDKGVETNLDYQMILGESNSINFEVKGPNRMVVYSEKNKYKDEFTWTPAQTGVYSFCFSSEQFYSNFKVIYFYLGVGYQNQMVAQRDGTQPKAMTLIETSSVNIRGFLSKASSIQTYFRNREAGGRQFAEDLNMRVILWSLGETIAVLVIGLGQVLVLRSFFSAPSPRSGTGFANGRIST